MNKHFKKNVVMSEEEEQLFQQSSSCWICEKFIDHDKEKVVTQLENLEVQHIVVVT